jgi:hypothetical protein
MHTLLDVFDNDHLEPLRILAAFVVALEHRTTRRCGSTWAA